jgi:hypothetical protein
MNKDLKIAITLAPFLLIGGYVISDQYLETKTSTEGIFSLSSQGDCAPFTADCILHSGDMQINITDKQGLTQANTSFPVDTVAISLVYKDGKEVIYGLERAGNEQYWERQTDIRSAFTQDKSAEKLRIVVQRKKSTYLSEFIPTDIEH